MKTLHFSNAPNRGSRKDRETAIDESGNEGRIFSGKKNIWPSAAIDAAYPPFLNFSGGWITAANVSLGCFQHNVLLSSVPTSTGTAGEISTREFQGFLSYANC